MSVSVLVCDDSEVVRKTAIEILRRAGYEIAGEAARGCDAIERYRECSPDLVLMDLRMPCLSGVEAVEAIVRADPDARVVMCTALADERDVGRAVAAGAIGYLVKPFDTADLLQAVARAVNWSRPAVAPRADQS